MSEDTTWESIVSTMKENSIKENRQAQIYYECPTCKNKIAEKRYNNYVFGSDCMCFQCDKVRMLDYVKVNKNVIK